MNAKILQLAQSPVILSETDIQNFIKLMDFPNKYIDILHQAKKIIKNYYLNNIIDTKDEYIIDNALLLVQGKKIEEKKYTVYQRKNDGKFFTFNSDGLTLIGGTVPIVSYQETIKLLQETESYQEFKIDTESFKKIVAESNHKKSKILLTQEMTSLLLFIFSAPYDLITHYNDYCHTLENTDDVDKIRKEIYKISDKHILEEIIIQGEKKFIENFEDYTSNTRTEIEQLLNTDIGNIFLLNEQIITSIKNEMTQYRNLLYPKIQEIHIASQQLKNYWIQSEETTGDIAQGMFQGAGMGMLGATLLGPIGGIIAVGATLLMNSDKEDKKSAIEDGLFENWEKTANTLYLTQLKEYHLAYQALRKNLTHQIFQNYKEAEQLAIKLDKHKEYLEYVNNDFYLITTEQEYKENFEISHSAFTLATV